MLSGAPDTLPSSPSFRGLGLLRRRVPGPPLPRLAALQQPPLREVSIFVHERNNYRLSAKRIAEIY